MDKIYIRNIQASVHIGIGAEERSIPQPIEVTLVMETSFDTCSISDDISDTIDYDRVTQYVINTIQAWNGCLIERLAVVLAQSILERFAIASVSVVIDKPCALKGRAASAAVEVTRRNGDKLGTIN